MRTVRIFISSPSDASRERDRLTRVARRLNSLYSDFVELEIIRWEDDFYSAHETFQTQIPEAKACDIVIGILKHRLGSPLPSSFPPMPKREPFLGEPYPSGTAYEILSSIANRLLDGGDKPDIYVFRDAEPPVVSLGSSEMERVGIEWRRLEEFAKRFFFTAEGDFRFAFQTFRSVNQFEEQIENLLRKWIETNIYAEHRSNWPVNIKGSPFRALDVFDIDHRDVFFGRDRDTARIVDLLADTAIEAQQAASAKHPFLLVIGPSGAGKSSLLRAGLVPGITASDLGGTEQWRAAVITPAAGGKGPFHALATALLGESPDQSSPSGGAADQKKNALLALPELRGGAFSSVDPLSSLLSHGDASAALVIVDALRRVEMALSTKETFDRPPKVRLLLVIDQLDEIFSSDVPASQRSAFAALLMELAKTDNVWIAASLRAGLYENFLNEPGFFALRNAGAIYELGPPGTTELAEIVRKPAQAADILYEKDAASGKTLDEILLADFDRPDMLPLLQFTLEALFQQRQIRDGVMTLTHAAYKTMNGIAGAVETAAGVAMAKLTGGEGEKLPKLLRTLVAAGQTADGKAAPLILRDVPVSHLEQDKGMLRLAEALTETRLLVASGSSSATRTFRLAHQRLLTLWGAAELALRDNATFYRVSGELEQANSRWQRNGRKHAQLIRDPVLLTEALRLAQTYRDEISAGNMDFIKMSRLRARLGSIALGATAAIFALLFAGTIWFYQRSKEAELVALDQKKKAEANFALAQDTLEGVVTDIASGLKDVEGMSVASRRTILTRVSRSIEMLQFIGGGGTALYETRLLMLNAFGETYSAGGDSDAALQSYRASIDLGQDLLQSTSGPDRAEMERGIAVNLERIGDILVGQGKRQEALQSYQNSWELRQKLLKVDPDNKTLQRDASVSLDRIAQVRQALGDVSGALQYYKDAVARIRKQLETNPDGRQGKRDLSVDLEHLADLQLSIGDRIKAGNLYDELLTIRKSLVASDPTDTLATSDLMVALLRQGDFNMTGGKPLIARQSYNEALALVRKLALTDPGKIEWQRTTAVTLNNLADIALSTGETDKARENYQQALAISRRLSGIDPKSIQFQGDIAYCLNKIADLEKIQGRYPEALSSYTQGLQLARSISASDPAQLRLQRDIAFGLSRIGDTKKAIDDLDGAMMAYKESLQISEKLGAAEPANIVYQLDIVLNSGRIADLYLTRGDNKLARAGYQSSLDVLRKIISANPDRMEWQRDMAVTLNKLGDTALSEGDIEAAGQSYQASLSIIRELLKKDGQSSGLLRDESYSLGKIAMLAHRQGKKEDAIAKYLEAVAIARQIAANNPGNQSQAQSDVIFLLLRVADLQTGDGRLATLREALSTAEKMATANILPAQQKNLPDIIRAAIAKPSP